MIVGAVRSSKKLPSMTAVNIAALKEAMAGR
jgi:hypothetical protein